jgi:hypothetical protein
VAPVIGAAFRLIVLPAHTGLLLVAVGTTELSFMVTETTNLDIDSQPSTVCDA